jgi:uncharacterized protein YcsI (UPF0317 family)
MQSPPPTHSELRQASLPAIRAAIRNGRYRRHTAGLAVGYQQCNLVILPEEFALDFFRFCHRNPRPCPLIGVSDTGDPMMRSLGADLDIRTDVPLYNVYRDGALAEQRDNIADVWRDDMVAFAIGCSFTFERALAAEGIALRHIEEDKTVSMFRTTIETVPAGPFGGGMVATMRPIPEEKVARAAEISSRYPQAHGGPVHIGDPSAIGISDLSRPDWGDPVSVEAGEFPMFWACGVTPQNAIIAAKLPICITHAPGAMLITELPESAEIPLPPSTAR